MSASDRINALDRELWQIITGHPEDPSGGHHPEYERIAILTEGVRAFEFGLMDIDQLWKLFFNYGPSEFSIIDWVSDRVDEGVYEERALEPHEPEEPEDLGPNVIPMPPRPRDF
ncbi:hypothetical protein [Paracoccus sp. (in: a-proteobacteria)]|uniref:hypothetical protein n=1 Tax=Paracoccus sp. TaxID=267 RepID=UPI0026E0D791|nr:hypothetical protein [Paracoccus sp. (in: a-proteobacteria)]MDO5647372.1 hypothetical protein [Paracoccus sp. (in: a-proteobacteria)]